jgi:hypothetical protein
VPVKGADLFSHPDPGHAGTNGGIGNADLLSCRFGAVYWKRKEYGEREETTNNAAKFFPANHTAYLA